MSRSVPTPSGHAPGEASRVDRLLAEGRALLADARHELSTREAAWLLGHVLGLDEARLRARDRQLVTPEDAQRYRELLSRRLAGEPAAYLIGHREFWGREFAVDRRVLIPRPETEHLIETVLGLDLPARPRLVDVGTGSGCLAVTLAAELPTAHVVATDRSLDALVVAGTNAARHGVDDRVAWLAADLLSGVRLDAIDLVVSNPPYIDPAIADTLSPEVRDHEPSMALFAADRGRAAIASLIDTARRLPEGSSMVLEIGYDQGDWLLSAAAARPWLGSAKVLDDYAGHPRVGVLQRA